MRRQPCRADDARRGPRRPRRAVGAVIVVAAAASLAAGASQAALGGGVSSIEADRLHFAAVSALTRGDGYAVQTLTLPNRGVIREFVANGVVFAIAWRGPGRPDMVQLLRGRFAVLQADNAPFSDRRAARVRRPLTVGRSDFVFQGGGYPGAFFGFAFLPQAAPPGFSTQALR